MFMIEKDKLRKFQEFLDYKFKNEELLEQALTTPQMANIIGKPSYEFLEILGDSVIKVIFILKLYQKGINTPSEITKIKATLESDKNLKRVANLMNLHEFILKTENQPIKGTRILADVFEALCGAIFLDSEYNLSIVEHKIIDPFITDLNINTQNSIISSKNELLEFLQEKFKTSIIIELEYQKSGEDHELIWIAKNPRILEKTKQIELIEITKKLKSGEFRNKKDAEKDIFAKILEYLKTKNK